MMKVFESVQVMFRELRKAKIVSLAEWRLMRKATGWKPDFDKFVNGLRGGNAAALRKRQEQDDRKASNAKVLRNLGLDKKKNTRKDGE